MNDTQRQTAAGKILWHSTMSLDGFVAGPGHEMDWMTDFTVRPGLIEEYVTSTGAVLGGRDGWDHAAVTDSRPYGGAWHGPLFVLTHHPEDTTPAEGVMFLSCDVADAARIALEARRTRLTLTPVSTTHEDSANGSLGAAACGGERGVVVSDNPWSVASLAAACRVSQATLARRFTALVGAPPMSFLTSWRLAVAADLLTDPSSTIGSAATQVGYTNAFPLSAAFKRVYGIAPTQYRRQAKTNQAVA